MDPPLRQTMQQRNRLLREEPLKFFGRHKFLVMRDQ
jgi:hypothetical protein